MFYKVIPNKTYSETVHSLLGVCVTLAVWLLRHVTEVLAQAKILQDGEGSPGQRPAGTRFMTGVPIRADTATSHFLNHWDQAR